MHTETAQTLIASDVPKWLIEYGNKLNWANPSIAQTARAQVKRYMLSLPQKNVDWRRSTLVGYDAGIIPDDVLSDISSVNWNAVPQLVQSGMKALLPSL